MQPTYTSTAGYPTAGYPAGARVIQGSTTLGATTIAGARPATTIASSPMVRSAAAAPVTALTGTRTINAQPLAAKTIAATPATVGARPARVIQGGSTLAAATTPTVRTVPATTISAAPRVIQAGTIASTGFAPRPATIISSGQQANVVGGPLTTQTAYEVKHKDDPQLQNLKELRKTCGLKDVPVNDALTALKACAVDGKLTRDQFYVGYANLLQSFSIDLPAVDVQKAVFDLFDRDDNGVVDMMELICGASLLCTGTEEDKIHAVFNVFDENGDGVISMDEMFKFLTSVFKVVLTPNVMAVMNSMGVAVESPEDLASVTALECFKTADLNHDGRLSVAEFKAWFFAPRNDPSFLFSPVRKLLQ